VTPARTGPGRRPAGGGGRRWHAAPGHVLRYPAELPAAAARSWRARRPDPGLARRTRSRASRARQRVCFSRSGL